MKIYFAASIRGGRENQEIYAELIQFLKKRAEVLTEHIASPALSQAGESGMSDVQIYTRDVKMIDEADAVIAEVTTPSLGVGYELGYAEASGKPVLCLFDRKQGKLLSAMVRGNRYFSIIDYSKIAESFTAVDEFLNHLGKD